MVSLGLGRLGWEWRPLAGLVMVGWGTSRLGGVPSGALDGSCSGLGCSDEALGGLLPRHAIALPPLTPPWTTKRVIGWHPASVVFETLTLRARKPFWACPATGVSLPKRVEASRPRYRTTSPPLSGGPTLRPHRPSWVRVKRHRPAHYPPSVRHPYAVARRVWRLLAHVGRGAERGEGFRLRHGARSVGRVHVSTYRRPTP